MYDEMTIWSAKQLENRLTDFFEHYDFELVTQKVLEKAAKNSEGWPERAANLAAYEMGSRRKDYMYQFYDMAVSQGINIGNYEIGSLIEETVDEFVEGEVASEIKKEIRRKIMVRWDNLLDKKLFQQRYSPRSFPVKGKVPQTKEEVAQNNAAKTNRAYREEVRLLKEELRKLKQEMWFSERKAAE